MNKTVKTLLLTFFIVGGLIYLLTVIRVVQKDPLPQKNPSDPNTLVEYSLSGGIVGFCSELTVYKNGEASIFDECDKKQMDFQISTDTLNELQNLSSKFTKFTYKELAESGMVDGTDEVLTFYGTGSQKPTDSQKRDIMIMMRPIIYENRSN